MSQVPPAPDSSDLLSEADLDLLLQGLGAAGAGAGGVASIFDHVIATGEPPPAVLQHFAEHGGLPSFAPAAIRNQVNEMASGDCAPPASERPTTRPHIQAEGTAADAAPAAATASVAVNPPRRVSRRVRTAARARSAGPVASSEESAGSGAGPGAGSGGGSSSPSASVNAARKRKPRTRPRQPAATTNQASRAHKKARTKSRATGSSTTYERRCVGPLVSCCGARVPRRVTTRRAHLLPLCRRRARVGELMQTLTKLLFPAGVVDTTSDECHSVDQADADAARRKVKKPTKTVSWQRGVAMCVAAPSPVFKRSRTCWQQQCTPSDMPAAAHKRWWIPILVQLSCPHLAQARFQRTLCSKSPLGRGYSSTFDSSVACPCVGRPYTRRVLAAPRGTGRWSPNSSDRTVVRSWQWCFG